MITMRQVNPMRVAFTLVELLVVVALLGLMATAILLRVDGVTDEARLNAATRMIQQTLRLARSQAMTRRRPAWIIFELDGSRYGLAHSDGEAAKSTKCQHTEGVKFKRGAYRQDSGPIDSSPKFKVRVMPTGASIPWAIELERGQQRRVLWTNGLTARLVSLDGMGLDAFRWSENAAPPEPRR